jgi:hypothetical protein
MRALVYTRLSGRIEPSVWEGKYPWNPKERLVTDWFLREIGQFARDGKGSRDYFERCNVRSGTVLDAVANHGGGPGVARPV